jgi:cytochrome c553
MKRKTIIFIKVLFIVSLFFPALPDTSRSDCLKVGPNLTLTISCGKFSGDFFTFSLIFFNNPADPKNLFWKLDQSTFNNTVSESDCVDIGLDLSMIITCAELGGTHYDFTLVSSDMTNLIWKLDPLTAGIKSGKDLFAQRCGACHTGNGMGSGSSGDRTGRTAQQIENAISSVPTMNQAVGDLSVPEIQAIADALKP